jgi:hypothetical protein
MYKSAAEESQTLQEPRRTSKIQLPIVSWQISSAKNNFWFFELQLEKEK